MEEKKIEKILRQRALISWAYLVIAISLVLATFLQNIFPDILNIYTEKISFLLVNGFAYWIPIWAISTIYLIHFIYGAIYFPYKYRRVIKMDENTIIWSSFNEPINMDLSFCRGYLPGIACILLFTILTEDSIPILYSIPSLIIWLVIHIILTMKSRTDNLFHMASTVIDITILMPWECDSDENEKEDNRHEYETAYFLLPKYENENTWMENLIKKYVRARKLEWEEEERGDELEEEVRLKAKELSEKLAREI